MEIREASKDAKSGNVIVIIGAYGGVGSALAERLANTDTNLILVGRDENKLASQSEAVGGSFFIVDATDFQALASCLEAVVAKFGRLDGVTCLTGSLFLKPAHLTSEADWQAVLATNLTTSFNTVRSASKLMRTTGGSIVLMSSVAASLGLPNHEALAAAKAGVEGLARAAAATYSRHGIRINCVAPGLLATPLTADLSHNPAGLNAALEMYPISRMGTAEEIAGVINWLLNNESSWVTGQTICVDGGLSRVRAAVRTAARS